MSLPLTIDRKDGLHILKVLGYACASAAISAAISFLATAHIEPQYMAIVPFVNAALVAAQRYLANTGDADEQ